MADRKFYGVRNGRVPGVYKSWPECREQVEGFSGAVFKSFPSWEEAEEYVKGNSKAMPLPPGKCGSECCEIYVDGSFNTEKNRYGWAFVVFEAGEQIFADSGAEENKEAASMRNVAGELAAVMRAVKWAAKEGKKPVVIHHDYTGIAAWARGDWQAKNKFTQAYAGFISPYLDRVTFSKVKGHSGVEGNEIADRLAGEAVRDREKDKES